MNSPISADVRNWAFDKLSIAVHCLSNILGSALNIFNLLENWECRDLNPGLLGEKHERYLCAKSFLPLTKPKLSAPRHPAFSQLAN